MKRLAMCVALRLLSLDVAVASAAEPANRGSTAEASTHFNRGVELYREGNLDAALAEFARANELAPNYRLLYNMAQLQSERHEYVRAIELLMQYLAQGGSEIAPARRKEVEQEQVRLRERVATLWVTADVETATLWINDQRVATLPLREPVLLNAGIARLRVEADGRKTYTKDLNVAGGDRPRLELVLEATPMPGDVLTRRDPKIDYTPVWEAGVATAALGLGTVTFGVLTSKANRNLDRQLGAFPGDERAIGDARSRLRTFAGLTDGVAVATLLAAGAGVYFLVSPRYEAAANDQPQQPGADPHGPLQHGPQVRVSAALGSISVDGTF